MTCNESGSLMERTHKLLQEDERSLLVIYKETDIPYFWLKKFSAKEIGNPSVNRVQFLYEFLTGTELDV